MRILIFLHVLFCLLYIVASAQKWTDKDKTDISVQNDDYFRRQHRQHPSRSHNRKKHGRWSRYKRPKKTRRPAQTTEATKSGQTTRHSSKAAARLNEIYLPVPRPPFRTIDLYSLKARTAAAPYSGEWIRLRGNSTYMNSGLVEVYRRGQWGIVCDDDWDMKDASVTCKQLGFKYGAVAALTKAHYGYGNYTEKDILMDQVQCDGQEKHLQDCLYLTKHDCKQHEAASVMCKVNEGCQEDWISAYGSCYKFFGGARNLREAMMKCYLLNASLLNVENQEENNFISNVLSLTSPETRWWYTGGKRIKRSWYWFNTVVTKERVSRQRATKRLRTNKINITFQKWFPGWPPNNYNAQPSKHHRHNCLVLTNMFHHPSGNPKNANYYFWSAYPCTVSGRRLDFICEKPAKPDPEECYVGNGASYRGMMAQTTKGTPCVNWEDSTSVNPNIYPGKGLGNHNYCRNPDNDVRPWCWVNHHLLKFGYCSIPKCTAQQSVTTTPSPTVPLGRDCPVGEFFCSVNAVCIPEDYHCDGENDCENGEDEEGCAYKIEKFVKYQNKEVTAFHHNATYISITLEMVI